MNHNVFHLDANESAIFKKKLEYVMAESFDTKYEPNQALALFPVSAEGGAGATQITWEKYSKAGSAVMANDYDTSFPLVDIFGEEETVKVRGIKAGYHYNIDEIRRAQMAGLPLETSRAITARMAIDNKLDDIAWSGDTATALKGFIGYSGVSEYTVVSGTSGSKLWSAKTADEILRDMHGLTHAVVEDTKGIERPDTMLLPLPLYNLIETKRLGDGSDETVMSYFMKTNKYIKRIEWINKLATAGADGKNRIYVFVNNPRNLRFFVPLPFEQYDPDKEGMTYKIMCYAKTAGMAIFYPKSVAYADYV